MRGNCGHLHVIEIDLKPAQNHAGCRCSLEWKFPFITGQFGSVKEKRDCCPFLKIGLYMDFVLEIIL